MNDAIKKYWNEAYAANQIMEKARQSTPVHPDFYKFLNEWKKLRKNYIAYCKRHNLDLNSEDLPDLYWFGSIQL